MQFTLSLEDRLVERAQHVARERGKSLSELLEDLVRQLAEAGEDSDVEREIEEFRRLSRESHGRSKGWRFDRDEIHGRA